METASMTNQRKVAIVTGATRGIGREIALGLARDGMSVIVNFLNDIAGAKELQNELSQFATDSIIVQADISDTSQVRQLMDAAIKHFGKVDVLVNNAGITLKAHLFEITDGAWDQVVDVNLKGTFLCAKIIGQLMYEQQTGCIINLASTAGLRPAPYSHHYVAAKAGVIGLTRALAMSLAPFVNVNAVAPGYVDTDARKTQAPERIQELISKIPLGRLARVTEIADVVRFLAGKGSYITGQTIIVDGGLTIGLM